MWFYGVPMRLYGVPMWFLCGSMWFLCGSMYFLCGSMYFPCSSMCFQCVLSVVLCGPNAMNISAYLRFPTIKHQPNSLVNRASIEVKRIVKARRMEINAAKTILLIILGFVICNTPIFAITWYDQDKHHHSSRLIVRKIFIGMAMLQVVIDPVVYFLRLKDFKRVLRQIIDDCLPDWLYSSCGCVMDDG